MTVDKKSDYTKGMEGFDKRYLPYKKQLIESLQQFSPDFADVVVRHGLYEIWEEYTPNLTYREKEIATIAALITENTVMEEITAHTENCLVQGMTKQQVMEILILLSLYIGVPKVMNVMDAVKKAFTNYDSFIKDK